MSFETRRYDFSCPNNVADFHFHFFCQSIRRFFAVVTWNIHRMIMRYEKSWKVLASAITHQRLNDSISSISAASAEKKTNLMSHFIGTLNWVNSLWKVNTHISMWLISSSITDQLHQVNWRIKNSHPKMHVINCAGTGASGAYKSCRN